MIAIEAQNLGKAYKLRHGSGSLYGTMLDTLQRKKTEEFWAVRHLNFQIKKGSTVGIIGHNGSGKSSTLGLTTGTISPSEGCVKTNGRISALLELGAGFHAELTGRENVFLNAALMGIAREDIQRKMDAIIDFSGLHEFIDQPVKNYSSGMYIRLGFAVATEIDPDILLVDEVLAVGDIEFQTKSLERMRKFKDKGKTILFVSHDLGAIEQFCDEVILLDHASLIDRGDPQWIISHYSKTMMIEEAHDEAHLAERRKQILEETANKRKLNQTTQNILDEVPDKPEGLHKHEHGSKALEFTNVEIVDQDDLDIKEALDPSSVKVKINYRANLDLEEVVFGFAIKSEKGQFIFGSNSALEGQEFKNIKRGDASITLELTNALPYGNFILSLSAHSADHKTQYHRQEDYYPFNVTSSKASIKYEGEFYVANTWS